MIFLQRFYRNYHEFQKMPPDWRATIIFAVTYLVVSTALILYAGLK